MIDIKNDNNAFESIANTRRIVLRSTETKQPSVIQI